jgi:hypothetical protein
VSDVERDIEKARDGIYDFAGDGAEEAEAFERVASAARSAPDLLAALEELCEIEYDPETGPPDPVLFWKRLTRARAAIAAAHQGEGTSDLEQALQDHERRRSEWLRGAHQGEEGT